MFARALLPSEVVLQVESWITYDPQVRPALVQSADRNRLVLQQHAAGIVIMNAAVPACLHSWLGWLLNLPLVLQPCTLHPAHGCPAARKLEQGLQADSWLLD